MSSSAARENWRTKRTAMIERFCASNGFKLDALNSGYQLRIEDSFDFYPTNGRWHFLPTGERGDWHTELDLKLVMLEMLKPELGVGRELDGYYETKPQPQVFNFLSEGYVSKWTFTYWIVKFKLWRKNR